MRIIAGRYKGRRLATPTWAGLRPTSDKLRETLFNILGPAIRAARVLDGYAGTGAVGIEALSRGAAHVSFVEKDPRAIALIEANLARCGLGTPQRPDNRYAIIRAWFADVEKWLGEAAFDVIFLDPPYGAEALVGALAAAEPLVGSETRLVIEHARRDTPAERAGGVELTRIVTSGDSALACYRRAAPAGRAAERPAGRPAERPTE